MNSLLAFLAKNIHLLPVFNPWKPYHPIVWIRLYTHFQMVCDVDIGCFEEDEGTNNLN